MCTRLRSGIILSKCSYTWFLCLPVIPTCRFAVLINHCLSGMDLSVYSPCVPFPLLAAAAAYREWSMHCFVEDRALCGCKGTPPVRLSLIPFPRQGSQLECLMLPSHTLTAIERGPQGPPATVLPRSNPASRQPKPKTPVPTPSAPHRLTGLLSWIFPKAMSVISAADSTSWFSLLCILLLPESRYQYFLNVN